jgi:hypothetical protein
VHVTTFGTYQDINRNFIDIHILRLETDRSPDFSACPPTGNSRISISFPDFAGPEPGVSRGYFLSAENCQKQRSTRHLSDDGNERV